MQHGQKSTDAQSQISCCLNKAKGPLQHGWMITYLTTSTYKINI